MFDFWRGKLWSETAGEVTAAEQRQHRRHRVWMRATVYPIDLYRDAIIHDASHSGLMGETDIKLDMGQTVHVSFDETSYYSGVVRWTNGRQFGLDLHDPLDLPPIGDMIDHGSMAGHQPRAERVRLNMPARIHTSAAPQPVTVRNLSRLGMLLDGAGAMRRGQQLLVRIGRDRLIPAKVRWSDGDLVGIQTKRELAVLPMVAADE